jgi:hypothetical protein
MAFFRSRRGRRGSCARVGLHNDIAFGDDATYGRVLEYSEPLDKSIKHSPEGGEMEHLLREAMSFGDGLAVLEAQSKLVSLDIRFTPSNCPHSVGLSPRRSVENIG